ncbi:MAG: hypothetical protein ABJD11_06075 [Gemmatimonadota bacterium]
MIVHRHTLIGEGTDAGFLGGMTVAFWYLALDLLAGHPLRTPSVLGQVLLFGRQSPDTTHPVFDALLIYTVVHFALFVIFGVLMALLVRLAVEYAIARFAVVILTVAFEVFFYGCISVLSTSLGSYFPSWTILAANLLAISVMGVYFWRVHPSLRESLQEEALGA